MRGGRTRERARGREEGSKGIYTRRLQENIKVGREKVDGQMDGWLDEEKHLYLTY